MSDGVGAPVVFVCRDMSVVREEVYDTAAAAMALRASDASAAKGKAVICSRRAADMYGLDVIESVSRQNSSFFMAVSIRLV